MSEMEGIQQLQAELKNDIRVLQKEFDTKIEKLTEKQSKLYYKIKGVMLNE